MSDLIERSAVLDLMRTNWADNDGDTAMQLSIDDVRELTAVRAVEDAVSREAVLSALSELPHEYKTKEQRARTGGIAACQVIVRELPPVTPKPRTGKWVKTGQSFLNPSKFRNYCCAECSVELDEHIRIAPNYCPNCGARMEGESE